MREGVVMDRKLAEEIVEKWATDNEKLIKDSEAMGSGGDERCDNWADAKEPFTHRYWYSWNTAQDWPTASVVICRHKVHQKWQYFLIAYFQPDRPPIFLPNFDDVQFMLIERDTLQG